MWMRRPLSREAVRNRLWGFLTGTGFGISIALLWLR